MQLLATLVPFRMPKSGQGYYSVTFPWHDVSPHNNLQMNILSAYFQTKLSTQVGN